MKVKEMVEILSQFPDNEIVTVIYPEDNYGEESGVIIDEVTYIKSSSKDNAKNGVFIRLG